MEDIEDIQDNEIDYPTPRFFRSLIFAFIVILALVILVSF